MGISSPTKKIPIPGYTEGKKFPKTPDFRGFCKNSGDKNPKIRKNPESPGFQDFSLGIFRGIFKSRSCSPGFRDFWDFALGIFRDFLEVLKSRSRSPGLWDFRDFSLGIFSRFSNPDPDPRDFGIFRSSPQ